MFIDSFLGWAALFLATYRVAFFISQEKGPFKVMIRLSAYFVDRAPVITEILECFYCLSVWLFAIAIAIVVKTDVLPLSVNPVVAALALSGLACIVFDASRGGAGEALPMIEEGEGDA